MKATILGLPSPIIYGIFYFKLLGDPENKIDCWAVMKNNNPLIENIAKKASADAVNVTA